MHGGRGGHWAEQKRDHRCSRIQNVHFSLFYLRKSLRISFGGMLRMNVNDSEGHGGKGKGGQLESIL